MLEFTPENLIALRNKKKLSQQEVADFVGISQVSYSMWERGETKPKHKSILRLKELFEDPDDRKTYKIPLYDDVGSIGGTSMVAENTAVYNPTDFIDAGDLFPGATAAIRHYGDSMREYPSGCVLLLQEIPPPYFFVWGEDYVIEYGYRNRITKKVQKGDSKEFIVAYSTNEDTYKDGRLIHEPVEVPVGEIRKILLVLGHIIKRHSSGIVYNKNIRQSKK